MTDTLTSTPHSTARALWAGGTALLAAVLAGTVSGLLQLAAPGAGGIVLLLVMLIPLTVIGMIDARTLRVPDLATGTIALAAASYTVTTVIVRTEPGLLLAAAAGAVTLGGFYFVLGVFGGVGFGDVKLAAALGLWLGAFDPLGWLCVPALAITISGAHRLARLIRGRRAPLPHAPALVISAVLTAVVLLVG